MGQITVTVSGSFGAPTTRTFSAENHGHAAAAGEAIAWLSGDVLPDAIANDHELHDGGPPPGGWPPRRNARPVGSHGSGS